MGAVWLATAVALSILSVVFGILLTKKESAPIDNATHSNLHLHKPEA